MLYYAVRLADLSKHPSSHEKLGFVRLISLKSKVFRNISPPAYVKQNSADTTERFDDLKDRHSSYFGCRPIGRWKDEHSVYLHTYICIKCPKGQEKSLYVSGVTDG